MKLVLIAISLSMAIILSSNSNAQTYHDRYYRQAKRLINFVFPDKTQNIMFKIAGCETGFTYKPNAYNRSGATGYFQILASHNGTTYSYSGISITVDYRQLSNPVYNTMVAYLMSHGGTQLGDWYSSKSCWA